MNTYLYQIFWAPIRKNDPFPQNWLKVQADNRDDARQEIIRLNLDLFKARKRADISLADDSGPKHKTGVPKCVVTVHVKVEDRETVASA